MAEGRPPAWLATTRIEAAWRAAREDIGAERGGHLPTVNLVGRVGRQEQLFPLGAGGQANLVDETRSIGVELQMPLFSGGGTRAAVSEAEYNAEQARLDVISARRQLLIDINDAYRNVQTTTIAGVADAHAAIAEIESRIAFVGLMERFDESLALMQDALALPLFTPLARRVNAAGDQRIRDALLGDAAAMQAAVDAYLVELKSRTTTPASASAKGSTSRGCAR